MKSTLKIDYERGRENNPVIKIVIPDYDSNPDIWLENQVDSDNDVRDKLIHDFIHSPLYSEANSLFEVKSAGKTDGENAVFVTTIGPVRPDRVLYMFRHAILNKFIPYDELIRLNKITQEYNDKIGSGFPEPEKNDKYGFKYHKINEFFDYIKQIPPAI